MSSNSEEMEQKKKSQAIDRILEEDSKKLRRECKILLLGRTRLAPLGDSAIANRLRSCRFRRKWQVDDCQADENHTPERLF